MDLGELVQLSTAEAHRRHFLKDLTDAFAQFTKPSVAAVVGFALGGGFEIAMAVRTCCTCLAYPWCPHAVLVGLKKTK